CQRENVEAALSRLRLIPCKFYFGYRVLQGSASEATVFSPFVRRRLITDYRLLRPSLLEQIFKRLAGIQWSRWRRRLDRNLCGLHIRRGSRVFLHGHAEFIERAIILRVFRGNPRGNRLRAFKLRARIEKAALLA